MSVGANCTAACIDTPTCTTCGRTKALIGRSYALADNGDRCTFECSGYRDEPRPGHLWPSEWCAHRDGEHSGCLSDCGGTTRKCPECDGDRTSTYYVDSVPTVEDCERCNGSGLVSR